MTSRSSFHWLALVLFSLSVGDVIGKTNATLVSDALYITNSSHILLLLVNDADSGQETSIIPIYTASSAGGGVQALSFSLPDNLLFWSEFFTIYSASIDYVGNTTTKIIVKTNTKVISGLTVDWISKHIYWTDAIGGTLEVSDFDGKLRRILLVDLDYPRTVCSDPVNKWLFWNEEGSNQIMRSFLDGSARAVFASNQSSNQMSANNRKLFLVDFDKKTLRIASVNDASDAQTIPLNGPDVNHVFGLATDGNTAYVTYWSRDNQLFMSTFNVTNSSSVSTRLGVAAKRLTSFPVLSAVYVSNQTQPAGNDPCGSSICQQGQLCLPVGSFYRCSCPTFGGLSLNSATGECQRPRNILLYTIADSGFVGFYDPIAENNGDYYFVARSSRPVAVTYDPVSQLVYWSDVHKRTIYRCNLDGSFTMPFIDRTKGYVVGIVDGMAVDYVGRRLIYTNLDEHIIGDLTYTWHKVESASIQYPLNVKTLVSEIADKPRAVAVDVTNALFYYTDWGGKASVVRSNLDGSNQTVIRTGLYNPNGLVLQGNTLLVADSNYKTRALSLGGSIDGSVYRMDIDGNNWTNVLSRNSTMGPGIKTPFGLGCNGRDVIYVSDWDSRAIIAYDISKDNSAPTVIVRGSSPMALFYTAVSLSARPATRTSSCRTCRDICLPRTFNSSVCTCNSYKARTLSTDGKTCAVPNGYLLVSDIDGVKMISLDNSNDKSSVYVASIGRSQKTNLVAFTFDPASNTAYYSDVFSKEIHALNVLSSSSRLLYSVNHLIDGLAVRNGTLYWTDFRIGLIASLAVDHHAPDEGHNTLLTGLSYPRAIDVHQTFIYWTEWGLNPRVARMPIDGPYIAQTLVGPGSGLRWPNGLFMAGNRFFVADGHPVQRRLLNCSLDGSSCEQISAVNNVNVKHIFDIHIVNDILYYSDWNTSTINVLPLSGRGLNKTLQPLATGFIRPSQFYFITNPGTPGTNSTSCASSESCPWPGSTCLQLLGSQQCICDDNYTSDGSSCVPKQSVKCGDYEVGATFSPPNKPCLTCQCLANHLFADPQNDGATCEVTLCPPPTDCENPTIPTGQCCPVCPPCSSGITIKNCPSSSSGFPAVNNISLPERSARALYEYEPTHRDCSGLSRNVRKVTDPVNNLFDLGTHTIVTTVTAYSADGESDDEAECRFTLNVNDNTAPIIHCPQTIHVYTDTSAVNFASAVKWSAPEVYDNAGSPEVVSDRAWATDFDEGTTQVTYIASDRTGNSVRCSFDVVVTRLVQTGTSGAVCRIPRLERGQLECRVKNASLECVTQCDPGFSKSSQTIPNSLTCVDGEWNETIPHNFEAFACLRIVAGTAHGSIGILASSDGSSCSTELDLSYTNFRLKTEIETKHQSKSQYRLRYDVQSSCSSSDNDVPDETTSPDVRVTVAVSGDYQEEADKMKLEQDINNILREISNDLRNEFLEVFLRNGRRVWSAPTLVVKNMAVTKGGCPLGSYLEKDIGCVYCPAGTYQNGLSCVDCPKGTYSDQEGSTKCTSCPPDRATTSVDHGATIIDQCVSIDTNQPHSESIYVLVIAVLSTVVVFLVLIVAVVVVLCYWRRRKRSRAFTMMPSARILGRPPSSSRHFNKAFENQDETYDEIPDSMVATTSSAGAVDNLYETGLPCSQYYTNGIEADVNAYETLLNCNKA